MQASSFLTREQLQLPELPFCQGKPLIPMRADQPDKFGTKPFSEPLYDIDAWVKKFLASNRESFVALGLDGHGIASRAFHYYAADGSLAVFIQRRHGSAVHDPDEARQAIAATFALIQDLFDAMKKQSVPKDKILLVVDSDFYGKGWGWIQADSKTLDPASWHATDDHPLVFAHEALSAL